MNINIGIRDFLPLRNSSVLEGAQTVAPKKGGDGGKGVIFEQNLKVAGVVRDLFTGGHGNSTFKEELFPIIDTKQVPTEMDWNVVDNTDKQGMEDALSFPLLEQRSLLDVLQQIATEELDKHDNVEGEELLHIKNFNGEELQRFENKLNELMQHIQAVDEKLKVLEVVVRTAEVKNLPLEKMHLHKANIEKETSHLQDEIEEIIVTKINPFLENEGLKKEHKDGLVKKVESILELDVATREIFQELKLRIESEIALVQKAKENLNIGKIHIWKENDITEQTTDKTLNPSVNLAHSPKSGQTLENHLNIEKTPLIDEPLKEIDIEQLKGDAPLNAMKEVKMDKTTENDIYREVKVPESETVVSTERPLPSSETFNIKDLQKVDKVAEKLELTMEQMQDKTKQKIDEFQKVIAKNEKILVQLKPESLGKVEMLFKRTSEGIEVSIELENTSSKQKVEALLDDIKKDFKDRNLEVNYEFREKGNERGEKEKDSERKNGIWNEERNEEKEENSFEDIMNEILEEVR